MKRVLLVFLGIFLACALFMIQGCILEAGIGEVAILEEGAALSIGVDGVNIFNIEEGAMSSAESQLFAREVRIAVGGYITDEAALTELENIRIAEQGAGRPPILQIVDEKGVSHDLAKIIDRRTIQFLDGKGEITLHHDIYAISGDNVSVRTTLRPNVYNAQRILTNKNMHIVAAVDEQSGCFRVYMGKDEIYWIPKQFLIPVIIVTDREHMVTHRYADSVLREKYRFENGKKNGEYEDFHYNGMLWTRRLYKDDKFMEIEATYSISGMRQDKGTLANGSGTFNVYDEGGNFRYIQTFNNGQLIQTVTATGGVTVASENNWALFRTNAVPFDIKKDSIMAGKDKAGIHGTAPLPHFDTTRVAFDPLRSSTPNYSSLSATGVSDDWGLFKPPSPPLTNSSQNNKQQTNGYPYQQVNKTYRKPTVFSGDVEFQGSITTTQITISANSNFFVEPGALVRSDIFLEKNAVLRIDGTVEGNIYNNGGRIFRTGYFRGRIYSKK